MLSTLFACLPLIILFCCLLASQCATRSQMICGQTLSLGHVGSHPHALQRCLSCWCESVEGFVTTHEKTLGHAKVGWARKKRPRKEAGRGRSFHDCGFANHCDGRRLQGL
jgi:hypothetical protein